MRLTFEQAKLLRELTFSLVPRLPAVIAGGFAADWSEANDIDLWMLSDPMLERTSDVLTKGRVNWMPATGGDVTIYDHAISEPSHAVAKIETPLIPIHVIGTDVATADDLLRTFDISTHRWAYTRNRVHVAGVGATTPYEDGRVLVYKFPTSTDARVKKLEERYGITIAPYVAPKKVDAAAA